MTSTDSAKWHANLKVAKFGPETTETMRLYLERNGLRSPDRFGAEPNAEEVALLRTEHGFVPDEITEVDGNLLTTLGLNRLTALFIGAAGSPRPFNNTNAIVGVGSSTTAETVGDTALGGNGSSTSAWYQGADSAPTSYPTQNNGVITCYSTFTGSNANFAWNEWGFGISATGTITAGNTFATVSGSGILINHKVQSVGTKASGSTWVAQATITIS